MINIADHIRQDKPFTEELYLTIVETDNLHYFNIIRDNYEEDIISSYAALHGHLHVLIWLEKRRFSWARDLFDKAAFNGHLEVLIWLKKHGCHRKSYPNSLACEQTVHNGHLHCLKWLRLNGFSINSFTCIVRALYYNHLDMAKWLREQGYPFNNDAYQFAVRAGNIEAIEWLLANNCPNNRSIMYFACFYGHLHVVDWARKRGFAWSFDSSQARNIKGPPELLQYLHDHRAPGFDRCSRDYNCSYCLQRIWISWQDNGTYLYWPPEEVMEDIILLVVI